MVPPPTNIGSTATEAITPYIEEDERRKREYARAHGLAGRYDEGTQQRYADLLAANDTAGAHQTLTDAMAGEFMDERDRPGYQPERIQASTITGPTHVYDAADTGAAERYGATLARDPRDVNVGPLSAVERVQAADAGHAGNAAVANAAELDPLAGAVRGKQDAYLSALEARSRGDAPSVAEASYNAKMADVTRNAMGIAGQARGSDKAYARLKAMDTIADQTRRAGFDSAQLRAGEIDAATNALGGGLSNVRGADLGQASAQAQLRQQASLANQQAINQRGEFNAGIGERSAERFQRASEANAAAGNARTMDEAQMRAGIDVGNVTRGQQNEQFNAAAQTGAAAANAAAGNQRQDNTAARKDDAAKTNAAAINRRPEFNATQTQDAATKNQAAGLQGAGLEVERKQGLAGSAQGMMGQGTSIQQSRIGKPDDPSFGDRALGAVTTLGAAAVQKSDERAKKDVKDVPESAAERLAKALDFKEYAYKEGEGEDDGRHIGVMAQDLERDPVGRKFVSKDDDGTRRVDYGQLASLLLAEAIKGRKEARR